MTQRFTAKELFNLRNNLPIDWLIINKLNIPFKRSAGILRFQCPCCDGFHTAINRSTNLARCFDCQRNFNPIDLIMAFRNMEFVESVMFLQQCSPTTGAQHPQTTKSAPRTGGEPLVIKEIFRRIITSTEGVK